MDHSEISLDTFFQSLTALPHEAQKEKLDKKIADLTSQRLLLQTTPTHTAAIAVPTTTQRHEHEVLNTPEFIEKALHALKNKRAELESIPTKEELEELFHTAMNLPSEVEQDRALVHFFKTCCRFPDKEIIKEILRSNPNFRIDDSRHLTFDPEHTPPLVEVPNVRFSLLTLAVEMKDRDLITLLRDLGANIEAIDGGGKTPLSLAIIKKDPQMVQFLHSLGVDINRRNISGWTCLTSTILFFPDIKMIKILLELGADVHQKDMYGGTPLMCAKRLGNQEIVQLLESKGATMDHIYPDGHTLLTQAVSEKNYESIPYLIDLGANINGIDGNGFTPLTWAVEQNDESMARTLIDLKANIDGVNENGCTPLTWAVNKNDQKMVRALLTLGANVNLIDSSGFNPLSVATFMGDQPMIDMLKREYHADQTLARQVFDIKTTASLTGLYGIVSFKDVHGQDHSIKLERIFNRFATHHLSQTVSSFLDSSTPSQEDLSLETRTRIKTILDQTDRSINSPESITTQEIVTQIQHGETVAVISGWTDHTISIIFGDNKIFICNRDEGSQKHAIMAYECPPTCISEEFINKIRSARSKNPQEFEQLIRQQLGTEIPIPDECFDMRWQKVGNCSWANTKAIFPVLLYLELKKLNPQIPPQELHKRAHQIYKLWSSQVRIEATKKYAESPIDELVPEMLTKLREKTISSRYLTQEQKKELLDLLQHKIEEKTALLARSGQSFPDTTEIKQIKESLQTHDTNMLYQLVTEAIRRNNKVLVQKIAAECDINVFLQLHPTLLQFARESNDPEMIQFLEKRENIAKSRLDNVIGAALVDIDYTLLSVPFSRIPFSIQPPETSFIQLTTVPHERYTTQQAETISSTPLSLQERQELIDTAKTLGLKLPTTHEGQSLADYISSDPEAFFTDLARRNSYATIPDTHQVLRENRHLESFVQRYNTKASELRTVWERSHAYDSLIKCRKISKRGLEKIFFMSAPSDLVGVGAFKNVFLQHIFKPSSAAATPYTTRADRQKEKIYSQSIDTSPVAITDFIHECTISEELEKKGVQHIVHMKRIDLIRPDGTPCMVGAMSEYCQKRTLLQFLRTYNPIPEEIRRGLAIELCTALDDMHQKGGYVHGDLHPKNVLVQLDAEGRPHIKLADFGLSSKKGTEQTGSWSKYVAPEQFEQISQRRSHFSSPTTDAYTLGDLLYGLVFDRSILGDASLSSNITSKSLQEEILFAPTQELARANIEKTRKQYQDIYASVAELERKHDPYASLLIGLFDPNPSTRWTAARAREFITQTPLS